MGNQSAVCKNKNELISHGKHSSWIQQDYTSQITLDSDYGDEEQEWRDPTSIMNSISLGSGQGPIHVTVNRDSKKISELHFDDGCSRSSSGRNRLSSCSASTSQSGYLDSKPPELGINKPLFVPTVFKWTSKPQSNSIAVSGSFNNWKKNITLSKYDDSSFYTIIDCPPGTHVYKFLIDGTWKHDPNQPFTKNIFGTYDNIVEVKKSDSLVIDALLHDENWCSRRKHHASQSLYGNNSPPGNYHNRIPKRTYNDYENQPPSMPLYLNESILDAAIPPNVEPSLLPTPGHVKLHHLYASSIKDGLICLSTTIRYRSKFITIIMHKSIC